eukprot:g7612.t1
MLSASALDKIKVKLWRPSLPTYEVRHGAKDIGPGAYDWHTSKVLSPSLESAAETARLLPARASWGSAERSDPRSLAPVGHRPLLPATVGAAAPAGTEPCERVARTRRVFERPVTQSSMFADHSQRSPVELKSSFELMDGPVEHHLGMPTRIPPAFSTLPRFSHPLRDNSRARDGDRAPGRVVRCDRFAAHVKQQRLRRQEEEEEEAQRQRQREEQHQAEQEIFESNGMRGAAAATTPSGAATRPLSSHYQLRFPQCITGNPEINRPGTGVGVHDPRRQPGQSPLSFSKKGWRPFACAVPRLDEYVTNGW